jgi:hypothetical protein
MIEHQIDLRDYGTLLEDLGQNLDDVIVLQILAAERYLCLVDEAIKVHGVVSLGQYFLLSARSIDVVFGVQRVLVGMGRRKLLRFRPTILQSLQTVHSEVIR